MSEKERILAEARHHLDPARRAAQREEFAQRAAELADRAMVERWRAPAETAPDWSEIDARIQAAIAAERQFILTAAGEAIGQMLADQREHDKQALVEEVNRLWLVVSELQATIAAYQRVDKVSRGEPFIDKLN